MCPLIVEDEGVLNFQMSGQTLRVSIILSWHTTNAIFSFIEPESVSFGHLASEIIEHFSNSLHGTI